MVRIRLFDDDELFMSDPQWADLVELVRAIDLPQAPPGEKRVIASRSVGVERISEE